MTEPLTVIARARAKPGKEVALQALLSTLDALLAEPPEIVTYTILSGGLPEKMQIG